MSDIEKPDATTCKNCETLFEGKFCPNCSQKANTHRFTIKHFLHDLFHAVTHTDKGILFLIRELLRRPGKVAREYNVGKRKKYFNPITFLLITMALQTYTIKKTDFFGSFIDSSKKFLQEITKNSKAGNAEIDNLEKAKVKNEKVMENSKLITFMFLPFLALLTWLFFKKSGFNYAENLVFNIFINGELSLFFVIFCVLPFVLYPPFVVSIFYIYFLISWIYSFIAYKQFYQQRWGITILKGIVVQSLYLAIVQQITNLVIGYL